MSHAHHRTKAENLRFSYNAGASIGFILLNLFLWAGFRSIEILLMLLVNVLISGIGFLLAWRALKKIRRTHGVIQGEAAARIGYWGNLGIFVATFFFFAFLVAYGVLKGDFL